MDKDLKRKDMAILKELNLRAYQLNDDRAKNILAAAASSPMVLLEIENDTTALEIETRKLNSAGLDCMFKPFYHQTVYCIGSNGTYPGFVYLHFVNDDEIRGISYGKVIHSNSLVPVKIDRRALTEISEDYFSELTHRCFIDLEEVSKSKVVKKNIKEMFKIFKDKNNRVSDVFSEQCLAIKESIEGGDHEVGGGDISALGLTVDEFSVAAADINNAIQRIIVNLGYTHISDYYPFEASSRNNKKKPANKKKTNPVLSPNKTIVRFIQRAVAEEHLTNEPGNGGKQKPHSRRGYWVTLNAERFKNHPMYKVKNGVYRRESWIGGESFSIGNVIYTPRK